MDRAKTQIVTRNRYSKVQAGATGAKEKATPLSQGDVNQMARRTSNKSTTPPPQESPEMTTIFVEPANVEQTIFKHPAEIARILSNSGISGYKDIRSVGRFRFRISFDSTGEANKVNDKRLHGTGLKKYNPIVRNEIIGLIKGVPRNFSEKEMKDNLESNQEVTLIERVKRKGRGEELRITEQVKVTFKGKEHPDSVFIYGVPFKVEIYIFPIKQCTNCWMYTHKTTDCKKRKKCGKCGSEHEDPNCDDRPKCINCRGQHTANARECPERMRQRKIKEAMQKERISMTEATEKFPKENNRFALLARMDEFPELNEEEEDSEEETGTQTVDHAKRHRNEKQRRQKGRNPETGPVRHENRNRAEMGVPAYQEKKE